MFIDDFMIFNMEGACGIMSMNYSTQELKHTSQLKIIRLIGFMRNYGHEQFNSRNSCVKYNSPMIRNIISKGINKSILNTLEFGDTTPLNDTQYMVFMRKLWA